MKNWYIVSYDIRDDKRLRRVAKTLQGFGVRLQYSVFRCHLSERDMERLRWELSKIMMKEDDVLIVGLCDHCTTKLRTRNPNTHWPDETDTYTIV